MQHISEGDGDQRHITVIKNITVTNLTKKESVKSNIEEINEPFRSFSVLEEEKKDWRPMNDKKTELSKTISDQNLISTEEENEDRVRKNPLSISHVSINLYFSRLNHHL